MPQSAGVRLSAALGASAGRIAASGPDLERICHEVVRTCAADAGASAVWLGRAEPDGRVVLVSGEPAGDAYLGSIEIRWDDTPLGRGPAGAALRSREVVVQRRMGADPAFAPWREAAAARGLRSCASFPLISHEGVFGVLVLFSDRRGFFTPTRLAALRLYAGQAAAALQGARIKSDLAVTSARFQAIFDAAPAGIVVFGPDERVIESNGAAAAMLGRSPEEMVGLLRDDLIASTDLEMSSKRIEELVHGEREEVSTLARLVRADGSQLWGALRVRRISASGEDLYFALIEDATERIEAEAELKTDEERLRAIFEGAPAGIVVATAEGRFIQVNPAFCAMSGYTREELIGASHASMTHPEDVSLARQAWEGIGREDVPVLVGQWRLVRKDGLVLDALLSFSVLREAAGPPAARLVVVQDVTELRRAERELAASAARLEAVFSRPGLFVFALDSAGRMTLVKGQAGESGEEAEAGGGSLFEAFAAAPEMLEVTRAVLEGEGQDAVVRLRDADATLDSHILPLLDQEGRVVGGVGVALDVTAVRRADLQVVDAAARFTALLAAAPVALFALDPDGTIRISAGTALSAIGGEPGDHEGRNFMDVCAGEPELAGAARRALAGELVQAGVHVNSAGRDLDVVASPLIAAGGRVEQVLIVATDVTDRRRAAATQARDEARSHFLSTMSQELRTPLDTILGFIQLLAGGSAGPLNEQQVRYLGSIEANGRRLVGLIDDTLDLSLVQAGKVDLNLEDVGLADAVERVASRIQPLAEAKSLELAVQLARGWRLRANTDRHRLDQVLWNLLSNAVKFTPEGGRVEVGVLPVEEGAEIYVEDTGTGIAPHNLERIFEEFTHPDSPSGREQNGSGLGLALTRGLVELMGGRISVASRVGEGSRFSVVLPRGGPRPAED